MKELAAQPMMQCLIIDDNHESIIALQEIILQVYPKQLRLLDACLTPSAAIRALDKKSNLPELIFLDISIDTSEHNNSFLEVLKYIKNKELGKIKICIYSAYTKTHLKQLLDDYSHLNLTICDKPPIKNDIIRVLDKAYKERKIIIKNTVLHESEIVYIRTTERKNTVQIITNKSQLNSLTDLQYHTVTINYMLQLLNENNFFGAQNIIINIAYIKSIESKRILLNANELDEQQQWITDFPESRMKDLKAFRNLFLQKNNLM